MVENMFLFENFIEIFGVFVFFLLGCVWFVDGEVLVSLTFI